MGGCVHAGRLLLLLLLLADTQARFCPALHPGSLLFIIACESTSRHTGTLSVGAL